MAPAAIGRCLTALLAIYDVESIPGANMSSHSLPQGLEAAFTPKAPPWPA